MSRERENGWQEQDIAAEQMTAIRGAEGKGFRSIVFSCLSVIARCSAVYGYVSHGTREQTSVSQPEYAKGTPRRWLQPSGLVFDRYRAEISVRLSAIVTGFIQALQTIVGTVPSNRPVSFFSNFYGLSNRDCLFISRTVTNFCR
jgi:hypothetical protein